MSAGGQLAGLNFPNWTGFSGQVLNAGPGPRRQPRDDPGVQRLARRRVVRRVSGPVHPVRDPAALRRRGGGQRGSAPRRQGLPRGHVLGEPGRPRRCRASTPTPGTRCSRRASDTGTVLCCHVGSSSKSASTTPDAPPRGPDEPVVGDGDLHARRPAVGRLLAPLPEAALRADRGRHRLDPVLPPAGRAHPRPAQRVDGARATAGLAAERAVPGAHPVLLHRGPRRGEAARRVQRRQRVLGVAITRTPTARGPTPPSGSRCCSRTSTPRSSTRSPTTTPCGTTSSTRSAPGRPERCTVGALRAEATDVDTVTRVGRLADERDLATWKQMTGAAARPRS